MMNPTILRVIPPVCCLIVLLLLYPSVRQWDRNYNITSSTLNMKEELAIENQTDLMANQVSLIQERLNELVSHTGARFTLNRTGMIEYSLDEDDDTYTAIFSIGSLNYTVDKNAVDATCKTPSCITLIRMSDEKNIESEKISFHVESAEQGDKLVAYLGQFEELSKEDTKIDTGIKRRLKKWIDKMM
jgi:hypothetical protein